jgi:hypothetical protein
MVELLDISVWAGIIPMAVAVLWPWLLLYWLDCRRQRKVMQAKYDRLMRKHYQPVIFKSMWTKDPVREQLEKGDNNA